MTREKIRVLVVDDSALVRKLIPEALKNERDIEVVGTAVDPYVARDKILKLEPDILTLDIEMPRMDGLTFLKILMEKHPMPVIILSSLTQKGSEQAVEALRLGAVDVLPKPHGSYSLGETGRLLGERIRGVMAAKIHSREKVAGAIPTGSGFTRNPYPVSDPPSGKRAPFVKKELPPLGELRAWHPRQIGLLGASTGGTEALRAVLECLPANIPPLCIVQHIPAFISGAFAERLNSVCAFEVREAKSGDILRPGLALLAPGDYHMVLIWTGNRYAVELKKGPKVWYQRPAVDVLFRSALSCVDDWAVGVILTGMGRDGAEGLLHLRNQGCRTLAQDEATSVVYGMPKAAVEAGGVDEVLPLGDVPSRLMASFLLKAHKRG